MNKTINSNLSNCFMLISKSVRRAKIKHSPFGGCFVFITKIYFEPTTDGFPEQHTRPPPVADAGSVCWRSGQNRQRRAGANDDFGHRKSASKQSLRETVQIRPPQPTLRTEKDIGSENPETTTVSGFFRPIFQSKIKKISFFQNDLWGGLKLNTRIISIFRKSIAFFAKTCYNLVNISPLC